MSEWRPIKTAPKNRLIDIWTVGFRSDPHRVSDVYYDNVCGEWRTSRPAGQLVCVREQYVTHWMNRPKPPSIDLDVDDLEHLEGMLEDRERG